MLKNNFILIIIVSASFLFVSQIKAQIKCSGNKMLTEKKCDGDDISTTEIKLAQIINDYRRQNNLPPVKINDALSVVANRHLLDISENLKKTTHSWSNCNYEINDLKTWDCLTEAPKRLNVYFNFPAYENLYRNLNGAAEPSAALEAWKKSALHNSLILNLNIWKDRNWDSLGVAVNGQYASIWFGSKSDSEIHSQLKDQGLGVSFESVTKNLSSIISITKSQSLADQSTWKGMSKDKTISIELTGNEADISRAELSLKIKIEANGSVNSQKHDVMLKFIENIMGANDRNEKWLDENLEKLKSQNSMTKTLVKDQKTIELKKENNFVVLVAKPAQKSALIRVF